MGLRHPLSQPVAGIILIFGLAGCDESRDAPAAVPDPTTAAAKLPVPPPLATETLDPLEVAGQRLHAIARSGTGDAEAEARRAMSRGDFRFVGYLFLVPGGWLAAYGVQCHPGVASQRSLVSAVFARNDVPIDSEGEKAQEASFRRFGAVYNATLLADTRFPHRDMCKPVPLGDERERAIPGR